MNFTTIFSFLEQFEAYTKVSSTVYGMVVNYRQNKKIESVEKDVLKIKNILGLSEIKLTENELKVISKFISTSIKLDKSVDLIPLMIISFKSLNLDEDIKDVLINLQSYSFIKENLFLFNYYTLDFSVFIKSNLIQSIFENSITYSELFRLVVNSLYNNYRKREILESDILMKKCELNEFLINPILYHLNLVGVITFKREMRNNDLVTFYFNIDKNKLHKLHRELNEV